MEAQEPNTSPLHWIQETTGTCRHRASIVCWRNSRFVLHELIDQHSALAAQRDPQSLHGPMRILSYTRFVVNALTAMKARIDEWVAYLYASGVDCSDLETALEEHQVLLGRVEEWEAGTIFSGITEHPQVLVQTYEMLARIDVAQLCLVAQALTIVGDSAERAALRAAG